MISGLKRYPILFAIFFVCYLALNYADSEMWGWDSKSPSDPTSDLAERLYETKIPAEPLEIYYVVDAFERLGLNTRYHYCLHRFFLRNILSRALGDRITQADNVNAACDSEDNAKVPIDDLVRRVLYSGIGLVLPQTTRGIEGGGTVIVTNKSNFRIKEISLEIAKKEPTITKNPVMVCSRDSSSPSIAPNENGTLTCSEKVAYEKLHEDDFKNQVTVQPK